MEYIINGIENKIKNLSAMQKISFVSAIVAGFLAHGYGMANNYIYHDATILDGLGITFGIGRWSLGFAGMLNDLVLGNFNLPFINVVISILFIALSSILVVDILRINKKFTAIFTGSLMAVYPVVTSSFAYNFTATYYFLALYLVCMAVYVMNKAAHDTTGLDYIDTKVAIKNKKVIVKAFLIAIICVAFSAGFYQAYLSVAATLFVALLIVDIYKNDEPFIIVFARGIIYAGTLCSGLVLYLIINKISGVVTKTAMVAYQGADDFGKLELAKIPGKIVQAYLHFFYIKWNGINVSKAMWGFIILFLAIAAVTIVIKLIKKNISISTKVLFVILVGILPLAVNLCYLMSTSENYSVHTLMRYATAFVLIVPMSLIEDDRNAFTNLSEILLAALLVCYIFMNNTAYLKMNLVQEEMTSYFSVMESRITSREGFKDDMPMVFVGQFHINDANLTKLADTYPEIQFLGYEYNAEDLINKESWLRYMRIHAGFEPVIGDLTNDIIENEEFSNMNCYPNDGSIKIINGRVVVKLSDQ